jgi:UDP-2,3-diacylglucosamine hydrolase
MKDNGLHIFFFVGNHDLWMADYFEKELGIPVFHEPQIYTFNNKKFFIGHGDGKGPGDLGYKRMKKVFTNPISKWFFRWLHPDLGVKLAQYMSVNNKIISGDDDAKFLGKESEWLYQYAQRKLEKDHYDFFIFGHRHLPLELPLNENSVYINLGDWVKYFTYGVFDGEKFELRKF